VIVEGEKDADNLWRIGIPATTNAGGVGKWNDSLRRHFIGADVIVLNDNDEAGRDHANDVAAKLLGFARRVRRLDLAQRWQDAPDKADVSLWLAQGFGGREELDEMIASAPDYDATIETPRPESSKVLPIEPCTIDETLAVFKHWLALPNHTPVLAVLGAVAANLLPGDPVWLGVIGPPSSAKTELLNSTSLLPNVVQAATVTPAGLLSGTPKKQYDRGGQGRIAAPARRLRHHHAQGFRLDPVAAPRCQGRGAGRLARDL